jgi:type II pantothenate kinase
MLITVRSGIVFIRVDGPKNFKILDASTIGASTYLGLLKLLTDFKYPEEALREASGGDNSNIDMSVGDIYGGTYANIGLSSHVIASSFGKVRSKRKDELKRIKDCDISRSLLSIIAGNMLQIGYMQATLENLSNIIVMGPYFDIPAFMQMASVHPSLKNRQLWSTSAKERSL